MSRRSFRRSLRRRDGRRRNCEAPLKRRPEPGAEAAAEQELQLRSLPEHLQPKRSKCLAAAKALAAKKNPSAKRTGGQSAEAEPARSGRKAGPAGRGRRGSGGSGGRTEPEQIARKEAVMRAEINLPGNGRRRTAAERRTRTGADGQVDRSAPGIEPEWQSARGTDDGGWLWSLRNASCRRE